MSRVLVTGATGNVGAEVVRACLALRLPLRLAGKSVQALRSRFPALEAVRLDFFDRDTWAPALAGCSRLFLLRPPHIGNMTETLNPFLGEARQQGVQHVVFLSVAGAEEREWVPHRAVERFLEDQSGWTILRPGFFAQNLATAYRRDIVEDSRLYVPAGEGRVAFVDVRDIGTAAGRILREPKSFDRRALTLTGPEALTFAEVARLLTTELGRPIRYVAASVPGYLVHLRFRRKLSWTQAVVQTVLHAGLRAGDASRVDETLEQVIGAQRRTMADYVRDAREAFSA